MPKLPDLARPIVGPPTCLKPDKADGKVSKERQHSAPAELLVEHFLSLLVLSVDLKFVLGNVQADCAYLSHIQPLSVFEGFLFGSVRRQC